MRIRFAVFIAAAITTAGCGGSTATQPLQTAALPLAAPQSLLGHPESGSWESHAARGRTGAPSSNMYVFVTNDTTFKQGTPAEVDYWPVGSTGDVPPTGVISGSDTGLTFGLEGVVVDATGEIYVASGFTSSILGFAPNSNGNVAPNVVISGSNTALGFPTGLALDGTGNLYVANQGTTGPSSIEEFAAGSNGNVAPIRTIAGKRTAFTNPTGIAVDAGGNIYLADQTQGAILLFDSGASGNARPRHVITGPSTHLAQVYGLAVDVLGIYAATYEHNPYLERFSLRANGNVPPRARIRGTATQLTPYFDGLTTAPDGSIYVVDRGTANGGGTPPSIVQFSGQAKGNVPPLTDITGPNTRLYIPLFVYVGQQPS